MNWGGGINVDTAAVTTNLLNGYNVSRLCLRQQEYVGNNIIQISTREMELTWK